MSFATTTWPDNGGYHTERKYCLYHMRRSYFAPRLSAGISLTRPVSAEMVEAPGTAPGSALLISQHVYRHSRRTGTPNIGPGTFLWKRCFVRCERGTARRDCRLIAFRPRATLPATVFSSLPSLPTGPTTMQQYLDLLTRVLEEGVDRGDRTGTGTRAVFGHQMRFDLEAGFPLLTTKKLHTRSIFHELLWFIKGDTNIRYLQENGVSIWDEWADENGDLGPVYGKQWRRWQAPDGTEIDQLADLVNAIRTTPESRRLMLSAWNPADLPNMALPPCHCLFQFFVAEGRLSCQLYQRSADIFLGVPFNIASYALLTHMIAAVCDLKPGEFVHTLGDAHLYHNHFDQARLQLTREPGPQPQLVLHRVPGSIDDFTFEDFEITGYQAQPNIPAPIAV